MKNIPEFPIHISPHHLTLSVPLEQYIRSKLPSLSRIGLDILGAEVILRRHHGTAKGRTFSASARLALPGRNIHARAVHENIYAAVSELTGLLSRRLRKRKTSLSDQNIRSFSRRTRPGLTSAVKLEKIVSREEMPQMSVLTS